jgi:hypothetical protein
MVRRRFRGAVVALVVLAVAIPTAALAHRIYEGWYTVKEFNSGNRCLDIKVTTDHGSYGNGYFQVEARTEKEYFVPYIGTIVRCYVPWEIPPQDFRTRLWVDKQNRATPCKDSGWIQYTAGPISYMQVWWGPFTSMSQLCGNGSYRARGRTEIRPGANWLGGAWSTAYHSLPTNPGGNGG